MPKIQCWAPWCSCSDFIAMQWQAAPKSQFGPGSTSVTQGGHRPTGAPRPLTQVCLCQAPAPQPLLLLSTAQLFSRYLHSPTCSRTARLVIPPIFLQSDVSTFHLRPPILYLTFSCTPQTPPQIRPPPATFMAQMSPDIPPSGHTSPQAHRPWFSSWQPATVLSPPTSQNCHYLLHILPCHCQRQGVLNISQSLCSYTNCMQMCRLFPCVICIFLIILYRTAHAAVQTYDLYNVFHMVLRLKGSWKQKFLIIQLVYWWPSVTQMFSTAEVWKKC